MLKRKIFALSAAAVMVLSGSTVAFADTQDKTINFDVNATNYDVTTGVGNKDNTTPVYVYITSMEDNSSVNVRALGINKSGDKFNLTENGTTGDLTDHVICHLGVQQSVHSQIKEHGYNKARVAFQSKNTFFSERVVGVWSPDSTRTYTHAWK